jgi:putative inorganic carbon (hco3(-)) transporter
MRAIALFLTLLVTMGYSFAYPYVGLMTWVWYALMSPQEAIYRFQQLPLNLVIAVFTLLAWFVSKEKKTAPGGLAAVLFYVLFAWMTLSLLVGLEPQWSVTIWNRVWKICLMGLAVAMLTNTKVRFHGIMWITALSLGYWGVKAGIFTILTGGAFHALGPATNEIGDNNAFALAIVMVIPILSYLYLHSGNRSVRIALIGSIIMCILTVLGSYSRGGVIALAVVGFAFWLRTRQKLFYPLAAAVIIVPSLKFMPDTFWERVNSIGQYQTDASFLERVDAWTVAWKYASSHFPFGAGFYALQVPFIYHQYSPSGIAHAAHSIYFQVLGEHGFGGLLLYLLVIGATFVTYSGIVRRTKNDPELAWANDLARMLQLSLLAFCVGGAALSVAYYDLFIMLVFLSAALSRYTRAAEQKSPQSLGIGAMLRASGPPRLPAFGSRFKPSQPPGNLRTE